MFCPRCSKQFTIDTSFCRICGLSLDGVAQIVKGEAATEPEIRTGPNGNVVRVGIGTLIVGMVTGLSIPVLKNLELFSAVEVARYFFLFLVMIAILILGAGIVVFPQKRYIRKKTRTISVNDRETRGLDTGRLEQLPPSDRSLDDFRMPATSREPGSVIEDTTRHLR